GDQHALFFAAAQLVQVAVGEGEGIGQGHAGARDFEVLAAFQRERAVMAGAAHEHDLRRGVGKMDLRLLLHDGAEPAQLAPAVACDVFPGPLGPRMPSIAPRSTANETRSSTARRPYENESSLTSIAGFIARACAG